MTRRCAGRDRLVTTGEGKSAGDSCFRGAGQTRGRQTFGHKNRRGVLTLRPHPNLGRAGAEPSIRELGIGGTPYSILYRARRQRVIMNTIWHGAEESGALARRWDREKTKVKMRLTQPRFWAFQAAFARFGGEAGRAREDLTVLPARFWLL